MGFNSKDSTLHKREQLNLLYDSLVSSQILIFIGALILAFTMAQFVDTLTLFVWLVILMISVFYRLIIKFYYDQTTELSWSKLKVWERRFLFGVFLSATVWGSAGIVLFVEQSVPHQVFLQLTIVTICIVAIRLLSPSLVALLIFLPVAIIPLALKIYFAGGQIHLSMTVMVVLYLVVSFVSGQRFNRNFRENQALRRETARREGLLKESEEKYRKLYQQAELANQAKSEFLANMSHEIRTPMNGVLGVVELLLQNELNVEQKQRAHTIKQSAHSLLSVINDILDFSKIEAGKLKIEQQTFDLFDHLKGFSAVVGSRIKEKNLVFHKQFKPDSQRWFLGDPGRIQQILFNLVDNAIKFTDQGSITLSYDLIEEDEDKATLRFEVIDTGIGIEAGMKDYLFDRFTQADGSTTRKYGGTGLGLSICQSLVQLMDGEIGFDSVPSQGTTFWFEIVLRKTQATGVDKYPPLSSPIDHRVFKGTILVVDDNQTNQLVAQGMLQALGLDVVLSDNGQAAIEMLKKQPFDAIFMDCQMPVLDGYKATQVIRSQAGEASWSAIPIIAMTASAMQGDKEKCLAAGMDDYIAKPIHHLMVKEKLSLWLPKKNQLQSEQLGHMKNIDESIPLFDYTVISERLFDDYLLIEKAVSNFLSGMEEHMSELNQAIEVEDFSQANEIARAINGSSATVGCMRVSQLASELELALARNDQSHIDPLFNKLNHTLIETTRVAHSTLKKEAVDYAQKKNAKS